MKTFFMIVLLVLGAGSLSACVHSAVYRSNVEDAHPPLGESLSIGDHAVHVVTQGPEDAAPVLLIHGASANLREFTWTLAPRLSEDLRVLIADRPGHGYSATPPRADTLEVQARQMAGVLQTKSPDQPAVLVGHSYGGAVALRVALDYPELVGGVILLAPVTHDWGDGGTTWYNNWASPPVTGHAFAQLVPVVGPAQAEQGVLSVFDPAPAPDGYYQKAGIPLLFRPATFRANARQVKKLKAELAAQQVRYPELQMPVTVFSGSEDTVLKPQLHVGQLKKQIDITLIALPHEGHMPHHGEGAAVADAIRQMATAINAPHSGVQPLANSANPN